MFMTILSSMTENQIERENSRRSIGDGRNREAETTILYYTLEMNARGRS